MLILFKENVLLWKRSATDTFCTETFCREDVLYNNHRQFLAFFRYQKRRIMFAVGLGSAKIFLKKFKVKNPCA
jgi:hypothetical protein